MMEDIYPFPMEETSDYPIVILCAGHSHWHRPHTFTREDAPFYAFEYVREGRGALTENGQSFDLAPGDVFLLHRGSSHRYAYEKGPALVKTWLAVNGPLVESLMQIYGLSGVYHVKGLKQAAPLFDRIHAIARKAFKESWHAQRVAPAFALLVHEIITSLAHRTQHWREKAAPDVTRVRQYIDANLGKPLRLP